MRRVLDEYGRPFDSRARASVTTSGTFADWIGPEVDGASIPKNREYESSTWIYAAINKIAEAISGAPFRVNTGEADKAKAVDDRHPLQSIFDMPNPYMPKSQLWYATIIYWMTRGEAFWWLIKDPSEKDGGMESGDTPTMIWPLDPCIFEPADASGAPIINNSQFPSQWRAMFTDGVRYFQPYQVARFSFFNPMNPLRGLAPVDVAMSAANSSYASGKWKEAFYKNSANPGGWIETSITDAKKVKEYRDLWEDRHKGPTKHGRMEVMPKDFKFVPNTMTSVEMEFIEGLKWNRDEMVAALGVPKAVLSITDDLNYATHLGQSRVFWTSRILPLMRDIEDVLWTSLFSRIEGGKYHGAFDISAVPELQSDIGEKISQGVSLSNLGYDPNDINDRLSLGMPEIDATASVDATLIADPTAPATPTTTIADTAMNGAQVASLQAIVADVSTGILAPESAKAMLKIAFPTIDEAEAASIIDPAAEFASKNPPEVTTPEANAANVADAQATVDTLTKEAPTPWTRSAMTGDEEKAYVDAVYRAVVTKSAKLLKESMVRYLNNLSDNQQSRLKSWMKDNDLKPTDLRDLTQSDVKKILFNRRQWDLEIAKVSKNAVLQAINKAILIVDKEMGGHTLGMQDPRIKGLYGKSVASLVRTNVSTQRRVRVALLAADAKNSDLQTKIDRLSKVFEGNEHRARVVAITESGFVASGARFEAMKAAGVKKHKWINVHDSHVRKSHTDQPIGSGGQSVKVGTRFSNGLLHPHEFGAAPEEVILCRCGTLMVK